MNIRKLKGLIVEKNTTQEAIAIAMGMNPSTYYRKMKGGGDSFTIRQIKQMVAAIPLTESEAIQIFLT